MKKAVASAAVLAGLVFAQGALAAPNSSKFAVSFNPAKLGSSDAATLHINVATTSDPVAAVNIFTGTSPVNLGSAGATIGNVDATAIAHDQGGLTLPLSGSVVADDPAKHVTDVCSPGTNQAVWNMNLSVAGQTLVVPIYVNKTTGAAQALGAYNLKICLPPWDVPVGTPGRAAFGAQLVDAKLTLNKIFTAPTSAGPSTWESLFTPYVAGKGTPNPAATWEARAIVLLPVVLSINTKYVKKTNAWQLTGMLSEGGKPVPSWSVRIARGPSATRLPTSSTTKTTATGTWKTAGHLKPRKTTFFRAFASAPERDYTQAGCQSPATSVAPAGCTSATLSAWSVTSPAVRIKP